MSEVRHASEKLVEVVWSSLQKEGQDRVAKDNELEGLIATLDDKLKNITAFSVEVVNSLPTVGRAKTIYFVPSANPSSLNVKDEYIWVNNQFEQIGSTAVDLSDYVKVNALNEALASYAKSSDLATVATTGSYSDLNNTNHKQSHYRNGNDAIDPDEIGALPKSAPFSGGSISWGDTDGLNLNADINVAGRVNSEDGILAGDEALGGTIYENETITRKSEDGDTVINLPEHDLGIHTLATTDDLYWGNIEDKPEEFSPCTHADEHAANGVDPIAPADIGAVAITDGVLTQGPSGHLETNAIKSLEGHYIAVPSEDGTMALKSDIPDVSGKLTATSAAAAFSTSTAYAVGDYVTYSGSLYKCTAAHSAGAWNAAHFTAETMMDFDSALVLDDVTGALRVTDASGSVVWMSDNARKYALVTTSTTTPAADSVSLLTVPSAGATITIPTDVSGKVTDFIVDAYAADGGTITIGNVGAVTIYTDDGVSLVTDVLTMAEGEVARIAFISMAYRPDAKPTYHAAKQVLTKYTAE